ncbi:GNAT family N-acetyltransferase [Blastococcus brunescens]|uniref:GNAT family N-acetyltransferase n=1 Tax=Blastococcus brunescens TaxID=1564165 RepID=A0ABZ1B4T8_9ACTN|nr:GNAT family N-acetyltransferase [Blastococcus sp. BMG 8361]WRL65801.1 GNAT family N-acetyltransferase [Blastococcus sp. BMG 8361]
MTVRRVVPADVAALDWLDDGTRTGVAAAEAAGAGRSLVLAEGGAEGLVGVLAVDLPPWRDRTVPWLWLVEVHPEHRGQGIGTGLLTEGHRQLAMSGHRVVELGVAQANPRAATLYRRLGYLDVGEGVDPGPEPWIRMRLTLRP